MMVRPNRSLCLMLGVCSLTVFSQPAVAELLVSGARGVDGVAVGTRFPDDHVFRLSVNSELSLQKLPDGAVYVMRGPYDGTLSSFIKNCSGPFAPVRIYCRVGDVDPWPLAGTRGRRSW
jgi:hypothetical protein